MLRWVAARSADVAAGTQTGQPEAPVSMNSYPVRWAGRRAVVTLPDEIDVTNSAQVGAALSQALQDGAAVIIADMTGTTFCASDGVKALIDARTTAAAA